MKIVIIFLSLTILFSSCAEENCIVPGTPEDVSAPLAISDAFLSASMTRATEVLGTGKSIGLFLSGTNYTTLTNVQYNYGSPNWLPAATTIYLTRNTANICAYYPYAASTASTLTLTPKVYALASDICYQTNQSASTPSNTTLSLTMVRAYSKIKLLISKDASYPGTGLITSISIANTNLISSNTLNMTTGIYGASPTKATFTDAAPGIANLSTSATKEYLMVPVDFASNNTTLTLTVDGSSLTGTVTSANLPALVKGYEYSITVSITGSALNISSVSTTNWEAGSGGSVTPV